MIVLYLITFKFYVMPSIYEMLNSQETVVLGSGRESDLVFKYPQISPVHCQISKVEDGVYLIVDLNSITGTYVNHIKITTGFATETDSIKIGHITFQITSEIDAEAIRSSHRTSSVLPQEPTPPSGRVKAPSDYSRSADSPSNVNTGHGANATPGPEPQTNTHSNSASSRTFERPETYSGKSYASQNSASQKRCFVVYFLAAPEDENICKAIYKHLSSIRFVSPLPIEMHGDFMITAGEEIEVYQQKLAEADIVLVFVSVDFLDNNGCYERLKTAIGNHNNRKTILIPILARNCMWKATPFANLPLLPKNQQPLNNRQYWNSEDDALTNVVDDIYKSINDFTKQSTLKAPVQNPITTPELKVNWRGNYLWKVFWKRVAAYLLDVIILMVPVLTMLYLWKDNFFVEENGTSTINMLIFYGILILIWSFFDSSRWRGTPGKRIMKLQISDDFGNPVSFQKALVRNVIKYSLFFFASKESSGIFTLVFWVAQILCFWLTKKFFHDHLSHTIIGERLKEDITASAEARPSINHPSNRRSPGFVGSSSTGQSMRSFNRGSIAVVGLFAAFCIGAFFLLKLVIDKNYSPGGNVNNFKTLLQSGPQPYVNEVDLTEDQKASLISAISYAANTEIEARQTLNLNMLERAYSGEALRAVRADIQDLASHDQRTQNHLENQQFIGFKMSPDGRAEVKEIETWSSDVYRISTNQWMGKIPGKDVPQTIFLKRRDDGWVVDAIVFDKR